MECVYFSLLCALSNSVCQIHSFIVKHCMALNLWERNAAVLTFLGLLVTALTSQGEKSDSHKRLPTSVPALSTNVS